MNLLSKFQNIPILLVIRDQFYIHIAFSTLEIYSIPFQSKSLLFEYFNWTELKNRTLITKVGRIILNDYHPQHQIAFLSIPPASYFVISGYIDNSFKLFKDGQILQTIRFHSVTFYQFVNIRNLSRVSILHMCQECVSISLPLAPKTIESQFGNSMPIKKSSMKVKRILEKFFMAIIMKLQL